MYDCYNYGTYSYDGTYSHHHDDNYIPMVKVYLNVCIYTSHLQNNSHYNEDYNHHVATDCHPYTVNV